MRSHGLLALFFVALLVRPALATTSHPDVFGPNFSFTGIQETTSTGDVEPLYGAPTGSGDQLDFSPTSFSASSSNGSPLDQTASQLQLLITALDPGTPIEEIVIQESGQTDFTGTGTDTTGAFVSISGLLTVLEATGPLPAGPIGFVATFAPTDLFGLVSTPGSTAWAGSVVIDVAAAAVGVTKAMLSLNNFLNAASEADSTASISKTSLSIAVVPEPGSLSLVAFGLLGLAMRARRRTLEA
ncbi:MAG: PEP-CTERM sorting domain-containing protein [Myxococcales bacterium]|nr:PEP-CTERM sorting domain-containing protein [Myxococcales bacterium]